MEGANDVVRHIILRIVVDQAGFAESLAAAREKLKALKQSEGEINKDRVKSNDSVTKAIGEQNKALGENAQSHEAAQRAAQSGGRAAVEQTKAETEQIKAGTKAVENRTIAEAKAAGIDEGTRQKRLDAARARSAARKQDIVNVAAAERNELVKTDALQVQLASAEKQRNLDAQKERSNGNKLAAAQVEQLLGEAAALNARAGATKAGGVTDRQVKRAESAARIDRQNDNASKSNTRLDANAASLQAVNKEREKGVQQLNAQRLITSGLIDLSRVATADATKATAESRKKNAEDKTSTEIQDRRNKSLRAEESSRASIAKIAAGTTLIDERALEVEERRERATRREAENKAKAQQRTVDTAHGQAIKEDADRTTPVDNTFSRVRDADEALTAVHVRAIATDKARTEAAEAEAKKRAKAADREAERVARAAEREAKAIEAARKKAPISAGLGGLFQNALDVVKTVAFAGPEGTRLDDSVKALRKVSNESGNTRKAVGAFFKEFTSGDHEAASVLEHITSRIKNLFAELKPAASGGGNLFSNIFGNIGNIGNGIVSAFDGMGKHIFSFQGLIVAAIAALGPLAAILGAVGAAALGLASNIVALSGVFLALPGIIGAAVAGFGALAIVLKPLSNVFSAYSAAQKEASSATAVGTSVALQYKEALLQQSEAELAHTRAIQDVPRAEQALANARQDATRKIEDYRTALKRLKFDQEGAELGTESALQNLRRTLADPTASVLDKKEAIHAYQGAQNDQDDANTQAKRTQQDASQAIAKGVSGADAVVAAQRALQDANNSVTETLYQEQEAALALKKALATKNAGGDAAAEYQKQLAKLPPETRKVAVAVLGLIKEGGPFSQLRNRLSENIFGPLSKDTGKFKTLLGELDTLLTPVSTAMGTLADKALTLFTNKDWKAFFASTGKNSASILTELGTAALSVADGFKGIVTAAAPFTGKLVSGIAGLADTFDRWANSKAGQKSIRDFLDITFKRIGEILPILGEFGKGIAGFFTALNNPSAAGKKAGKPDFTTSINDGILEIAKNFAKLGQQAADPNSGFHKFLDAVLPLLGQVGHFLGAAGTAIGKLFSDPRNIKEAEGLLHNLATKWLPQLAEIFSQLSASGVISKLAAGIGGVFGAIQNILAHGGLQAFSAIGDVLKLIGSTVDYLVKHVPLLSSVIGVLATVFAVALGGGLLYKIGLVIGKFTFLSNLINGIFKTLGKGFRLPTLNDPNPGKNKPGASGSTGSAGSVVTGTEELTVLRRMELYLRQIAVNTGGTGNIPDNTTSGEEDGKGKKGKGGKGKGVKGAESAAVHDAEEVAEDAAGAAAGGKAAGGKGIIKRILGFLGKGAAGDAGSVAVGTLVPNSGGIFSGIGRGIKGIFGGGKGSAATSAAEEAAESAGKSGLLRTVGTSALKGLKGGLPGVLATVGATVGGEYLTNKFVKNDKDKSSVNNAIGTVASYAGTGALIGSVIPGIGTAAGGVIGGVVGGAKALVTDPNLRSFVGGKLHSGVKAVGGFLGEAGSAIGGAASTVGGGALDLGKTILGSLGTAGGKIGDFFTKTIPGFFNKGVTGITNFFTKTLPSLPGKFFDFFFVSVGRVIRFFTVTLPHAAYEFFTKTIPSVLETGWHKFKSILIDPVINFIKGIPGFFTKTIPHWFENVQAFISDKITKPIHNFINGIPDFFTKTVPHWFDTVETWISNKISKPIETFVKTTVPNFFTQTIPHWFETAPAWFKTHVIDPVTTFFTTTIPNFFTTTLPNAISQLPGYLYDNLVQPVLDFFSGIAGHIGDFLKGGFDWAKGLFHRAGNDIDKGEKGSMSGGVVQGVYQGIEDTARYRLTPGEFVLRRSKAQEPGAMTILNDWNSGRLKPADFFNGLGASVRPPVMSMVPPSAAAMTGAAVVNHTVNHAPIMGDVTINNPVRERSETSLRRQVQIAAIRHRR